MKKLFLSFILLALHSAAARRCFTCDNVGAGEDCITSPASVPNGASNCQSPNDEYCYTSRVEEPGNKITFNRGCCRVIDKSPVCPHGAEFQIITNEDPPYKRYLTRCDDDDLCNDTEGDNGNGNSAGGGGGSLVVEGNASKKKQNGNVDSGSTSRSKSGFVSVIVLMTSFALWLR